MIQLIYRHKAGLLYDQAEALVQSPLFFCLRNNYYLPYALNRKSFLSCQSVVSKEKLGYLEHILFLCSCSFSKTAFPFHALALQRAAFSDELSAQHGPESQSFV